MKIAYICSPYSAATQVDRKRNLDYAKRLTKYALECGYAPIAPHLYIAQLLNDNEPSEREIGMKAGIEMLRLCDVIIVGKKYGFSQGMNEEIRAASTIGVAVEEIVEPKLSTGEDATIRSDEGVSSLRPCLIGERKGYFHKWEDYSQTVNESPLIGGAPAGVFARTFAIVEFENGAVERVNVNDVRFCDSKKLQKENE